MRAVLIVFVVAAAFAVSAVLAEEKKIGTATSPGEKSEGKNENHEGSDYHGSDNKGARIAGNINNNNKECDTPLGKLKPGEERHQGCQKTYCCKNGEYKIFACDQRQPNCQANPDECCK